MRACVCVCVCEWVCGCVGTHVLIGRKKKKVHVRTCFAKLKLQCIYMYIHVHTQYTILVHACLLLIHKNMKFGNSLICFHYECMNTIQVGSSSTADPKPTIILPAHADKRIAIQQKAEPPKGA